MAISSDYLDFDSAESRELLGPLVRTIDNDDMFVESCIVTVFFQTQQKGWFWNTVKTESVSKKEQFLKESLAIQNNKVVSVLRRLAPIVSLNEPEQNLALISEICDLIKKDIQASNEFLYAFIFASLGKNESEIRQKLDNIPPKEGRDLMLQTKQNIQNSSDLELFQQIQSLFPNLVSVVKMVSNIDIPTPEDIKKKEILKISNCYMQAMKNVHDRPGVKELTKITVHVSLVKRSDPRELNTGYYLVTNQKPGEWTWNQKNNSTITSA